MTEIERIKANIQGMRSDAEQVLAQRRNRLNELKVIDSQSIEIPGLLQQIAICEQEVQAYANCIRIINGDKYCI